MKSCLSTQLDFDEWAELAARDPQGFETLRQETIDAAIDRARSTQQRRRLQGLQWRIDMVRQQAKTPLAACVHMYDMMWDKVLGDEGMLEMMQPFRSGPAAPQAVSSDSRLRPASPRRAQIIPFPG